MVISLLVFHFFRQHQILFTFKNFEHSKRVKLKNEEITWTTVAWLPNSNSFWYSILIMS